MTPAGLICNLIYPFISKLQTQEHRTEAKSPSFFFYCLGCGRSWQHPCPLGFSFSTRPAFLNRNAYRDLLGIERESWTSSTRLLVCSWLCYLCKLKAVIRLQFMVYKLVGKSHQSLMSMEKNTQSSPESPWKPFYFNFPQGKTYNLKEHLYFWENTCWIWWKSFPKK